MSRIDAIEKSMDDLAYQIGYASALNNVLTALAQTLEVGHDSALSAVTALHSTVNSLIARNDAKTDQTKARLDDLLSRRGRRPPPEPK